MHSTYQRASVTRVQNRPGTAPARGVSLADYAQALEARSDGRRYGRNKVKDVPGQAVVTFPDGRVERVPFTQDTVAEGRVVWIRTAWRRRRSRRPRSLTIFQVAD